MNTEKILTVEKVAELAGVTPDVIIDLIENGDLLAFGSKKNMVRLCDLNSFLGQETTLLQNDNNAVDFSENQRYHPSHSIIIEDLSEMEWNNMEKTGKKEHKAYFDEQKKRWCIALSLGKNADGKRIRKVISGATQADMWDAYREFISQQKEVAPVAQDTKLVKDGIAKQLGIATYRPEQDVLFSDCYAKFLRGLENGVVNRTYGGYVANSKYIVDKLGHLKMYELNREVIQDFLNDLREDKYCKGKERPTYHYYSQAKINNVFNLLHRFIIEYSNDDVRTAILPRDYMAQMKKPRTKALRGDDPIPYTKEEIRKILEAVKDDTTIYCWVFLMAELGCRPSEVLALRFRDIDFNKKTVYISKTLGKEAKFDPVTHKRTSKYEPIFKNLKNDNGRNKSVNYQIRHLKLSPEALDVISKLQKEIRNNKQLSESKRQYGTEDCIFTSRKGALAIYEDYTQRYERLLKKAGLSSSEMNPYRFRHTFCTELFRRNVNLKTVQMMMGDNTPDMVLKVYANIQKEEALLASEKMACRMEDIVGKGQTVANG